MSRQLVKPAINVTSALCAPCSAAWPGRRLEQLVLPVDAGAGEMRVQIDQPGQQRRPPRSITARSGGRRDGADRFDALAANDDDCGETTAPPRPSISARRAPR